MSEYSGWMVHRRGLEFLRWCRGDALRIGGGSAEYWK